MSNIESLKENIYTLTEHEFSEFREWFLEYENQKWDRQIESDYQSGKFNDLILKARMEYNQGNVREL